MAKTIKVWITFLAGRYEPCGAPPGCGKLGPSVEVGFGRDRYVTKSGYTGMTGAIWQSCPYFRF